MCLVENNITSHPLTNRSHGDHSALCRGAWPFFCLIFFGLAGFDDWLFWVSWFGLIQHVLVW